MAIMAMDGTMLSLTLPARIGLRHLAWGIRADQVMVWVEGQL